MVWPQLKICWSYSYSWSWCCCCWELQSSLILIMATWQKLGLLAHKIFFCKQPDHNLTTICRQFHDDRLQSVWQLYKSWIKRVAPALWQLFGRPMTARYWWIKNNFFFSFKQFTQTRVHNIPVFAPFTFTMYS